MFASWEQIAVTVGTTVVVAAGAYLAVVWLVTPGVVRAVRARNPRNETLVNAVRAYGRVVGVVAAAVAALVASGYGWVLSESAVVVAAATLAVGVAGQDVFENVVSGGFLVADRNFNVGDWVAWGEGTGGVVEVVGFRSTRVRTAANEIVTVPNAELATRAVRAPYARGRYRTAVSVAVAHDADLAAATDAAGEAAAGVPDVASSPPPETLASFGDGVVVLTVRVWIREPTHAEVARVESRLTRAVRDALADAGVDASPTPGRELSGRVTVNSVES
ncbi:mechanosensitive ion channel domain-containing protein [Halobacterium litoreum]|uniref:Mechanosensitive ion channel domain-containing protein n=1 Tax=Halobacterium litoreum TaxID=2039234 RepID=A0ABD5NGG8_9EURY|nr:mechanosensitive ion channel domain-containing protein [Halobacterium litoreum]UHH12980.1 mechanosensitive ion channel family protein [Halobacterium litoreum]